MCKMFKISNKALNILVDKRQTQASREIRVTQKTQTTGKTKETRKTVLIGLTELKVLKISSRDASASKNNHLTQHCEMCKKF